MFVLLYQQFNEGLLKNLQIMTTLSNLEIGQHFTKFRSMLTYVYLGILNGEFHYLELYVSNPESHTTTEDFRVVIK